MARDSKSQSELEAGTSHPYGPANTRQAEDYVQWLEEIFDDFKLVAKEGRSDALAHTIGALKYHTAKSFPQIGKVDMDTVLKCFNEPTCVLFRESLEHPGS